MNPMYVVPIVPRNLSKNETVIQIAELLDHLQNISDDIFRRVQGRLEVNRVRMGEIKDRISEAHSKINRLKGAKKATQVFSSSKYPAADVNRDYVSLFEGEGVVELKRHKVKHKNFTPVYEAVEKVSTFNNVNLEIKGKNKCDGLGDVPFNLDCVNDLLLYNSGKNLYKNFEMSDALKGPQHIREEDTVDVSDIGVAPYSIREGTTHNKSSVHPFFYSPKTGEVPQLDVPLDLPDLPGIADLRYENEIISNIVPFANHSIVTDIETIEEVKNEEKKLPTQVKIEENPTPPPPPPPQPPKEENLPKLDSLPNLNQLPKIDNLANSESLPKLDNLPKSEPIKKEEKLPQLDARASLMEAIRKAGGSRNAKLKNIEKQTNKQEQNKPPSGDLMADLHAKLSMRRKGISGSKKPEDEHGLDASSAFGKISARIPPPIKTELTDSTNTEDEDWDE